MSPNPPAFAPQTGVPHALAPNLRLLLAPNASPMTERGTNTYLLGDTAITVIDPGPADPKHLAAIMAAVPQGGRIDTVLVTHTHLDHSPGAAPLAAQTGARVLAFGDTHAGRSARMSALDTSDLGGGEGLDHAFRPDDTLRDGQVIQTGAGALHALHTPGHLGNHLCFRWRDLVFSGDHLMGWAPSLVSPPDGDLTDFMNSLSKIESLGALTLLPGHGAPIADGAARARDIRAHRLMRETAIVHALDRGPMSPWQITQAVYSDTPAALLPAALRNVLAHLIDLSARDIVQFDGPISAHQPARQHRP